MIRREGEGEYPVSAALDGSDCPGLMLAASRRMEVGELVVRTYNLKEIMAVSLGKTGMQPLFLWKVEKSGLKISIALFHWIWYNISI